MLTMVIHLKANLVYSKMLVLYKLFKRTKAQKSKIIYVLKKMTTLQLNNNQLQMMLMALKQKISNC